MALSAVKITVLVCPYNGDGDIAEWFSKFELVAKLREIKETESIVPLMFLEGSAFVIYNGLSDSGKKSYEAIKGALAEAFSLNVFQVYEQLTKRVCGDESVVCLTDLQKLTRLAGILPDTLLIRAFIVGLPSVMSRELRAVSKIDSFSLKAIVDQARSLMAELVEKPVVVVAAQPTVEPKPKSKPQNRRCFRCGGPHVMRNCKSKLSIVCWTCGQEGHTIKNCTLGIKSRRVGAPATLPKLE